MRDHSVLLTCLDSAFHARIKEINVTSLSQARDVTVHEGLGLQDGHVMIHYGLEVAHLRLSNHAAGQGAEG